MQRIFVLLLFVLIADNQLQAQCPVASFTVPDTVCTGSPLPLTNTSTGNGLTYKWDFCPREIHGLTFYQYYRYTNYTLYTMTDMDLLKVGTGYYLITMDSIYNNFVVGTIGNHISNRPMDAIVHGSFQKLDCFDFIVEGDTTVYGVAAYSPDNSLFLMTFPGGITATPTLSPLPIFTSVSSPADIKIVKSDNNYYALIANKGNGLVSCLYFGNTMTNTPVELYNIAVPGAIKLSDIDVITTCSPPVGFVTDSKVGDITRLSFNSGLGAAPTITSYGNTGSSGNNSVAITQEFESYFVCFTDTANNQLKWLQFNNNNFANTPTVVTSPTFYFKPNQAEALTDSSYTRFIVNDLPSLSFVDQLFADTCLSFYSEDQNPSFSYFSTGWNKISLTVTDSNGYQSIAYDSVYVISGPTAKFNFSGNQCFGPSNAISFNDQSSSPSGQITNWFWEFGDGATSTQQNPTHTYQAAGTYQVKLTITAGCQKDTIIPIVIKPLPTVGFTYTLSCAKSLTPFTDQTTAASGIQSWQWNFGDGSPLNTQQNPQHTFAAGGTYAVQLIATTNDGCTDSLSTNVQVKATPVGAFTATRTCLGDTVHFINNSTINDGTTLNYLWDLGNGITSAQTDTIFYYQGAGSYPVSLIAYSNQGCSDTLIQNVFISTPPAVNFSFPANNCQRNGVAFTDNTVGANLFSWQWHFGDGDSSAQQNPVHIYYNSGNFNVQLTVSSGNDCAASFSQTIYITPGPAAAFTTGNGCQGISTGFTDQSTISGSGSIISWMWYFGDGDSATTNNASHIYALPGSYTAILKVTSDQGCADTTSQLVNVYENPVAGFFIQSLRCANTDIYFLDTSYIGNGIITQWQWQFSNGVVSSQPNPNIIFNTAGNASATLTVTTADGCSSTKTNNFIVRPQPDFTFTYNGICKGQSTVFNYQPNTSISAYAWTWSFGDNTFAFSPYTNHNYAASGNYGVSLAVVDSFGCSKTVVDTVTIYNQPKVSFISTGICQFEPVLFTNQTTLNNAIINGWLWNFGDSQNSTDQSPQHSYNGTGNYNVSLIAYAEGGCNDTLSSIVNIKPAPIASFNIMPETGAPGNTIQFVNTTSGATSYVWDFGDGSPAQFTASPSHIYSNTGTYTVNLSATSLFGCTSNTSKSFDVIVPNIDLWLKSISYTLSDNYLKVISQIANVGNTTVNRFDLLLQAEGKGTILESCSEQIPYNTEKSYELKTQLAITPGYIPEYLCLTIKSVEGSEDGNRYNNEQCITLNPSKALAVISPNPINETLMLQLYFPESGDLALTIYDVSGKKLSTLFNHTIDAGFQKLNFDLPYLSKGVYLLQVTSSNFNQQIKFIKQ
jgi:PKD repeat protein